MYIVTVHFTGCSYQLYVCFDQDYLILLGVNKGQPINGEWTLYVTVLHFQLACHWIILVTYSYTSLIVVNDLTATKRVSCVDRHTGGTVMKSSLVLFQETKPKKKKEERGRWPHKKDQEKISLFQHFLRTENWCYRCIFSILHWFLSELSTYLLRHLFLVPGLFLCHVHDLWTLRGKALPRSSRWIPRRGRRATPARTFDCASLQGNTTTSPLTQTNVKQSCESQRELSVPADKPAELLFTR